MSARLLGAFVVLFALAGCGSDVIIVSEAGSELHVPREYVASKRNSWWVEYSGGTDKSVGQLLEIPVSLLPAASIEGKESLIILVTPSVARIGPALSPPAVARDGGANEFVAVEGPVAGTQRIYHDADTGGSSAWSLFTMSDGRLARDSGDLGDEKWLGECARMELTASMCTAVVTVGRYAVEFSGGESLLARRRELATEIGHLFCSWSSSRKQSDAGCQNANSGN